MLGVELNGKRAVCPLGLWEHDESWNLTPTTRSIKVVKVIAFREEGNSYRKSRGCEWEKRISMDEYSLKHGVVGHFGKN